MVNDIPTIHPWSKGDTILHENDGRIGWSADRTTRTNEYSQLQCHSTGGGRRWRARRCVTTQFEIVRYLIDGLAGGYDALWLLVLDDGSGFSLQHALSHWSALETAHVTPLLSSISPHGVLLTEDVHTVPGLAKLLEGCSM